MNADVRIEIDLHPYHFHKASLPEIEKNRWVQNQWPLVYFIENEKDKLAYVGESTNAYSRINNHLANPKRASLKKITLIGCDRFNKSATLDIESQLIQYISADGIYKLQNGNAGLQHHNYYQRDVYKGLFKQIWKRLGEANLVKNSLEEIENSNIFKYSPYKSLSQDQHRSVLDIIRIFNERSPSPTFVRGSAGTGKTILATYLMKLLNADLSDEDEIPESDELFREEYRLLEQFKSRFPSPTIGLVIPMTSLRQTLTTVFGQVHGLKRNMIIGPSEVFKKKYDILFVDEAHRLKQRKNITNYRSFDVNNKKLGLGDEGTELDWIMQNSSYQVFFYDEAQSVKPSDIPKDKFDTLRDQGEVIQLHSQMRVEGGNDYISFVDRLLHCRLETEDSDFEPVNYDLRFFESLGDLVSEIQKKETEMGLCRMIAGYSWPWISRTEGKDDIVIEDLGFRWNTEDKDWINSANAANEIGCIHTTQGNDLNYAGIIFGKEITYNKHLERLEIIPDNYYDKKGKAGVKDTEKLKAYIINIYKTLMYRGIKGTFVYACDPDLRDYLQKHLTFETVLESATAAPSTTPETTVLPFTPLTEEEARPGLNCLPMYDIKAAAGSFSELQETDSFQFVRLTEHFEYRPEYFTCQVMGESMNKIIPNGSWCLFRKDPGGSREGKIVLVQHHDIQDSDFGAGFTVKSYHSEKTRADTFWQHSKIMLEPRTTSPGYEPIVLDGEDEIAALKVVGVFVTLLGPKV